MVKPEQGIRISMPGLAEWMEKPVAPFKPDFGLSGTIRLNRPAHLSFVNGNVSSIAEVSSEEPCFREDAGLGTMRGLVFALLCEIILAGVAIAGWQLWRLFL